MTATTARRRTTTPTSPVTATDGTTAHDDAHIVGDGHDGTTAHDDAHIVGDGHDGTTAHDDAHIVGDGHDGTTAHDDAHIVGDGHDGTTAHDDAHIVGDGHDGPTAHDDGDRMYLSGHQGAVAHDDAHIVGDGHDGSTAHDDTHMAVDFEFGGDSRFVVRVWDGEPASVSVIAAPLGSQLSIIWYWDGGEWHAWIPGMSSMLPDFSVSAAGVLVLVASE